MSDAQQPLNALPQGHRLQERVLGIGGFGVTYLGFDHHLDKVVNLPSDIATHTAAPQASEFRDFFAAHMAPIQMICRNLERGDNLDY